MVKLVCPISFWIVYGSTPVWAKRVVKVCSQIVKPEISHTGFLKFVFESPPQHMDIDLAAFGVSEHKVPGLALDFPYTLFLLELTSREISDKKPKGIRQCSLFENTPKMRRKEWQR